MSAFKLGNMTFGSLFKKPSTVCYPFETKPQPPGLKGQIGIQADQCILCGMCDKSCTTGAITVNKDDSFWEINRFRCVQCGYCIVVCPKQCLAMLPDYASAAVDKSRERYNIPDGSLASQSEESPATMRRPGPLKRSTYAPTPATAAEAQALEASMGVETQADHQLEDLILLLGDDEKIRKVREALGK